MTFPSSYGRADPVEDAYLTELLRNFMHSTWRYLETGGREDKLDRIASSVGTAVAILLIVWPPAQGRRPGAFGLLMSMGRKLWTYRRWIL